MMTPRKERFVAKYLLTLNATESAVFAGYSSKTARSQGSRLLADVDIAAEIQQAQARIAAEVNIDTKVVLGELLRLARADIGQAFKDGKLLPLHEMPEDVRRAISSIEVEQETEKRGAVTKVRFWPKVQALENLARHLGLFQHDNAQKAESFAAIVLQAQRMREGKAKT